MTRYFLKIFTTWRSFSRANIRNFSQEFLLFSSSNRMYPSTRYVVVYRAQKRSLPFTISNIFNFLTFLIVEFWIQRWYNYNFYMHNVHPNLPQIKVLFLFEKKIDVVKWCIEATGFSSLVRTSFAQLNFPCWVSMRKLSCCFCIAASSVATKTHWLIRSFLSHFRVRNLPFSRRPHTSHRRDGARASSVRQVLSIIRLSNRVRFSVLTPKGFSLKLPASYGQ